jgi:hypothetical protein
MKILTKFTKFAFSIALILNFAPNNLNAATNAKKEVQKLLAKRNILTLPSLSSQVSAYSVKSSTNISAATPPTLKSIASQSVAPNSIKSLFWRDINGINVIDSLNSGSPSADACNEFFAGSSDGQSGGLGACHLAESVGYSYSNIVMSGVSMCFIKNLPTKANDSSGGITLNSGTYPKNNIENLFATPEGSTARLVKVNTFGGSINENAPKTIFVEVPAESTNKQAKKLYSANLWFCDEGNQIVGYDNISISNSLLFTVNHSDQNHGFKTVNLTGFLEKHGKNLDWDSSKSRTATTAAQEGNGGDGVFLTNIEITKSNLIKLKRLDNFNNISKSYQISKFSGFSAEDLRFLSGAFNEIHGDHPLDAGIDFDTFFTIDTNNSFIADANKEDLYSGFYTSNLELNFDTSKYSCAAAPDIEITVDNANESLKTTAGKCQKETEGLQNMHFCHDDVQVKQAEESVKTNCHQGTPTPQPGQGPPPPPPHH